MEKYYSVIEFAEILRCHAETIRKNIRNGKIIALKISGRHNSAYRIPHSELKRLTLRQMYEE